MAKKPKRTQKLTFVEIVMYADADVIKAAYEARIRIDELLEVREEAYRKIGEVETQIEEVVGESGAFDFPPPPLPVAGFRPRPAPRPTRPKTDKPEASGEENGGSDADAPEDNTPDETTDAG